MELVSTKWVGSKLCTLGEVDSVLASIYLGIASLFYGHGGKSIFIGIGVCIILLYES